MTPNTIINNKLKSQFPSRGNFEDVITTFLKCTYS